MRSPLRPHGLLAALLPLALMSSGAAPGARPEAPAAPSARQPYLPEGTARMSRLLLDIARRTNPIHHPFMSAERAAILRRDLGIEKDPSRRVELSFHLAEELLYAGRTEDSITVIRGLMQPPEELRPFAPPPRMLREMLAVALLRTGEQANCIIHHGTESCLLPIRGSGIHSDQRGSRAAMAELEAMLRETPDDLGLRWLLNVAAMTVGDYPEKLPREHVIPPSVFDSDYDIKRFWDVAPKTGIQVMGRSGGAVMEDFNGDGLLDIMMSANGMRDQMRYFQSAGDGTFTERTEAAGLIGEIGGLNMASADYNNDGFVDVLVLRGGWFRRAGSIPNSLLRNNGDGTFEDVTESAGLLSYHPTQTGTWADYDNDGWLDLFIGNESTPDDPHPCELYHNDRDGTFSLRSVNIGNADLGYVKGTAWGDYNNDGRPDLYVSVGDGENHLFRNDGPIAPSAAGGADWKFTDVTREAGVAEPRFSFGTWFFDYDNDGWLDLFVCPYALNDVGDMLALYLGMPARAEVPRLYRNNRDGTFTDVASKVRLTRAALVMGHNFGDLDNDGWLDLYLGTGNPNLEMIIPNRMFRNAGGSYFQDVTTSGGFGHLQKGHGVAFGDLDNDGDQDVFEEMGGAYTGDVAQSVLYENPGHGGRWITLKLEGRRSNRSGVGARLLARVKTPGGSREIHLTAGTGGSFGASSLQQEMGLGDAVSIQELRVSWPSGAIQSFKDVPMDRAYRLVESEERLVPVELRKLKLGGPA